MFCYIIRSMMVAVFFLHDSRIQKNTTNSTSSCRNCCRLYYTSKNVSKQQQEDNLDHNPSNDVKCTLFFVVDLAASEEIDIMFHLVLPIVACWK